jgi:hypothetical protein
MQVNSLRLVWRVDRGNGRSAKSNHRHTGDTAINLNRRSLFRFTGAIAATAALQDAGAASDANGPGISARAPELSTSPELVHTCAALVNAPPKAAFDFLADPRALGRWSLGALNVTETERKGIYTGFSMFDGSQAWLAIDARPELLLIDYRVGTVDNLVPRIFARVVPGKVVGLAENQCYVSLTAWRTASMNVERWYRLRASHEAEILLIDSQIETLQKGN